MDSSLSVCQSAIKRFDSFAKTILRNELRNWIKSNESRLRHEVMFSQFDEHVIEELCIWELEDEPVFMCEQIKVLQFNIYIKNELLFQALNSLNEIKRSIILMSF